MAEEDMCEGCGQLSATKETDDMVRVCDPCFALCLEESNVLQEG